jgi:hypothetical protein
VELHSYKTEQRSTDNQQADDLFSRAEALLNGSEAIFQRASDSGNSRLALMGVKEVRGCIELLARMKIAASSVAPTAHDRGVGSNTRAGLDAARWAVVCQLLGDVLGHWHHLASTVASGLRDLGLDDAAATVLKDVAASLRPPDISSFLETLPQIPTRTLTTDDIAIIARVVLEELGDHPTIRDRMTARFRVIEAELTPTA